MFCKLNGRVAVLAGVLIMAIAGVVLAQCNEQLGAMGPPTAGQLRLQVTLSDGQTITLNCAQVDVQFSSGGQMRVADSGAVPLSSGVATAAPVTEPPLPPVYEEAATLEMHESGAGTPFVPRLPEDVLEEAAPPKF